MKTSFTLCGLVALALVLTGSGCARRMNVATGTTIGLHATPGDGQSQSPQVTLAYKRAEIALVPTAGASARKKPDTDAYSSLAVIDFQTKWWRGTSIDQFIATGHAARDIQTPDAKGGNGNQFTAALAKYARTDSAATLRNWIKSAPDKAERKKREDAIKAWIPADAEYDFADLLTDGSLESKRKKFLSEKGETLGILKKP